MPPSEENRAARNLVDLRELVGKLWAQRDQAPLGSREVACVTTDHPGNVVEAEALNLAGDPERRRNPGHELSFFRRL